MLPGLDALELGRLRMSVGYGTHKKGRPLSPTEVGALIRKAHNKGASLDECAKGIQLSKDQVQRFLRISDLSNDIGHLIDWGSGSSFLGFTAAVELAKLKVVEDQKTVANAVLSDGLSSKEVRQVVQLRERSGRDVKACLDEALGMRPKVERRYVFVGSVAPESVEALGLLAQVQRNAILSAGIASINLQDATGRLGLRFFTLIGGESFNASMQKVGKKNIEALLRTCIVEAIENA